MAPRLSIRHYMPANCFWVREQQKEEKLELIWYHLGEARANTACEPWQLGLVLYPH